MPENEKGILPIISLSEVDLTMDTGRRDRGSDTKGSASAEEGKKVRTDGPVTALKSTLRPGTLRRAD